MEIIIDRYPKVRDEFIRNWNAPLQDSFKNMSVMAMLLMPKAISQGDIEPDLADEMIFLLDIYFESHKDKIKDLAKNDIIL
jgi:hypothetical protein